MCYEALNSLETGSTEDGKKKFAQKKLAAEPLFKSVMEMFRRNKRAATGSMVHPKMDRLRSLVLQYFSDQQTESTDMGAHDKPPKESKVMVFAAYRRAVEQIVEHLNLDAPLIRAHRFIGQASSREGIKGLTQKEQLRVN